MAMARACIYAKFLPKIMQLEHENMQARWCLMVSNKALDGLAWGLFIMLIGVGWWASNYYQMDNGSYTALGVGLIRIGMHANALLRSFTKSEPIKKIR